MRIKLNRNIKLVLLGSDCDSSEGWDLPNYHTKFCHSSEGWNLLLGNLMTLDVAKPMVPFLLHN